jgi:hypothetical protein
VDFARAAPALARRVRRVLLVLFMIVFIQMIRRRRTFNIQYSIEDIQLFEDIENANPKDG